MLLADLKTLLGFARPFRGALLLSALLSVGASLAVLAVPWLAGRFAGTVVAADSTLDTAPLLLGILALFAVQSLLRFAHNWVSTRTGEHIYADLRVRVYDHLQSLPIGFFNARRQGDVLSLLFVDVATLGRFISNTLVGIAPMLLTFAGALVAMWVLSASLALFALLIAPVLVLLVWFLARRVRGLSLAVRDEETTAYAVAEENLSILPTLKAFAREPHESTRYAHQIAQTLKLRAQRRRITSALGPITQFAVAVAIVLALWLAGPMLTQGELSPGELVSFLLYGALLARPLYAFAGLVGNVQTARGALQRLLEALDQSPEAFNESGHELDITGGEIEFREVCFAYPGAQPVLKELSLHINAGETVAITGPNGGGKSTLISLLLHFHQPTSGTIAIDGTSIADVSRSSLRRQIGLVPQHIMLFDGTIAENIAYGSPDAAAAEIEAAAQKACAHEFISALPDGYATRVGGRGVRLSGGERQRIALARALLSNPPILVLDEGTGMLDPDGERTFLNQARDVFAGRTVILVTHQPASLTLASRVFRLADGQLHEVQSAAQQVAGGA